MVMIAFGMRSMPACTHRRNWGGEGRGGVGWGGHTVKRRDVATAHARVTHLPTADHGLIDV